MSDNKRLFFAFSLETPWPDVFPPGRVLKPEDRHMTLAFMGSTSLTPLIETLPSLPPLPFEIGPACRFEKILFLPPRHSKIAAWQVGFLEKEQEIIGFQQSLILWLKNQGFSPDEKKFFLPHVTVCREPEDRKIWHEHFEKLPLYLSGFHLYESLGLSHYRSLWNASFLPPFEEIEHTADLAFNIYGNCVQNLYLHALLALSFKFPPLLDSIRSNELVSSLDDCVIALNDALTKADIERGCPFKAISFHGNLKQVAKNILQWEMIVDV